MIKSSSAKLRQQLHSISNGSISNDILEVKWPEGVPESVWFFGAQFFFSRIFFIQFLVITSWWLINNRQLRNSKTTLLCNKRAATYSINERITCHHLTFNKFLHQNKPETRHDIVIWQLMNLTHQFMPDHEHNTKPLSELEIKDLTNVLNHTMLFAKKRYSDLQFVRTHSIYRRFDAVRGMTYRMHLNFMTEHGRTTVLKR